MVTGDEVVRFTLYIACAYLEIGDVAKAETELREIVQRFEIKDAAKVNEVRRAIEAYIAAERPNAAAAPRFSIRRGMAGASAPLVAGEAE